jgi:hypothetical protein
MFKKKKKSKKIKIPDEGVKIPKALLAPEELKKYFYGDKLPKISLHYIKYIWQTQWHRNKTILVRFFLTNGKTSEFVISPSTPFFEYNGGVYIIDSDYMKEDITSGYSILIYHQKLSVPLPINPNIDNIKNMIASNKDSKDIQENINPRTLKSVVNATVIQKVLAGGQIEGTFQTLLYFAIGNAIATFLLLMMMGWGIIRK